jgi:acyl-CoA thioester hydrolase
MTSSNSRAMSDRASPMPRSAFRHFMPMQTRWHDNDIFGHVNNVVYYSYFDTAVNCHITDAGLMDPQHAGIVGVVAESSCSYFRSVAFPDALEVGLAITKLGRSSVVYALGLFKKGEDMSAATCRFVHVYVDRKTNQTMPIPADYRALFATILVSQS